MSLGIVVLGHGSRASVAEANQVAFEVASLVKVKSGEQLVETAIMNRESGLAGIDEAVDKLIAGGATQIIIAPMFLANGVHIQSDIPEEIAVLESKYPSVPIKMAGHIGPDPRIADIIIERIREAM